MKQNVLEKLSSTFPIFYESSGFITVFTKPRRFTLYSVHILFLKTLCNTVFARVICAPAYFAHPNF